MQREATGVNDLYQASIVVLVHEGGHPRGAVALPPPIFLNLLFVRWNFLQGPETNMNKVADLCAISEKGYAASMVVTNHNKKVS